MRVSVRKRDAYSEHMILKPVHLIPYFYELTNKPLEHTPPVMSEDSLHNHLRDMLRRSVGVLEYCVQKFNDGFSE